MGIFPTSASAAAFFFSSSSLCTVSAGDSVASRGSVAVGVATTAGDEVGVASPVGLAVGATVGLGALEVVAGLAVLVAEVATLVVGVGEHSSHAVSSVLAKAKLFS